MKKILLTLFLSLTIYGQTIKDISNIVGIRENQLIGHGLVVGLAGTGDKSQFTMQSLQNLLRNSYIKIPASSIKSKNIATVMVTAVLPAFARQGDKLKLKISSIGDAKSIDGGLLLLTQLKGVDGKVYALAQGTIMANDKIKTSGYIYEGAMVENELEYSLKDEKFITLSLLQQDAKIASLCEEKINDKFGKNIAVAYDTRTIEIAKPDNMSIIRFISEVQNIKIESMMKKKVIIDPVKEIIIAGADITINPVTISRKNFTIRIKKSNLDDKGWADPATNIGVDIGDDVNIGQKAVEVNVDNALVNTKQQPTVSDLMRAMKTMKVNITEIIETIKMLDRLGAINADVEMVR
ncbi:MAG: flagellar basal body P-ring protein FlgI [Epsilonproteobacteria bacterium]|nr:MAG: flagellar basal body P-ring protein FlgI [Campylobacterota bacterium]